MQLARATGGPRKRQRWSTMAKISLVALQLAWVAIALWWMGTAAKPRTVLDKHRGPLQPDRGRFHVVVTGGAGFIGSHCALMLLEAGHAVTIIDNLSRGNPGAVVELTKFAPTNRLGFVKVDLGHREALVRVMQNMNPKPDLVIHFAAIAYVAESMADPILYYKNITAATTFLLDAMKVAGIDKLVYSSTCAVYGNQDVLPITEASPPKPINPYGAAKLAAEDVIRAYAKSNPNFTSVILRYFNVYGSDPQGRLGEYPQPSLRHHSRISGACLDAALGYIDHLAIKGTQHPTKDGSCIRDYVHVTDLVRAHIMTMDKLTNPPELFNIGSGNPVSVKEFVTACRNVTGKDIKVIEQKEARAGDYAEVWAKIDKITEKLGWTPEFTNVYDGLRHAWTWRSAHPDGYGLNS